MAGIEPATDGLRNRCSTTELHWRPKEVSRTRFSKLQRAGRPRADHHPVRRADEVVVALVRLRRHAELLQPNDRARLVEDSHHALLSERGRRGGHAHVEIAVTDLDGHLKVRFSQFHRRGL